MCSGKRSYQAADIFDASRMAYDRDRDEYAKRAVTIDRLMIVRRLREIGVSRLRDERIEAILSAADQLEKEIRDAE